VNIHSLIKPSLKILNKFKVEVVNEKTKGISMILESKIKVFFGWDKGTLQKPNYVHYMRITKSKLCNPNYVM
jgi:hypothetical protein